MLISCKKTEKAGTEYILSMHPILCFRSHQKLSKMMMILKGKDKTHL